MCYPTDPRDIGAKIWKDTLDQRRQQFVEQVYLSRVRAITSPGMDHMAVIEQAIEAFNRIEALCD